MKAMEAEGEKLDLTHIKMYPCVVPDRGASEQTMSVALSKLDDLAGRNKSSEKKSRWKFWQLKRFRQTGNQAICFTSIPTSK
jgi:hypothetical protein